MAFPLQSVNIQVGSAREPINGQDIIRMEDGTIRVYQTHRTQAYRFRLIWDYLTEAQANSAWSHYTSNKLTADTYTWLDSANYSLTYAGTPKKTPSEGKTTTASLWRFEANLIGTAV